MSHWNPRKQPCSNCEAAELTQISEQDGEWVLWCPDCGAILTANEFDPISSSDWRVPKLNELNLKGNSSSRRA